MLFYIVIEYFYTIKCAVFLHLESFNNDENYLTLLNLTMDWKKSRLEMTNDTTFENLRVVFDVSYFSLYFVLSPCGHFVFFSRRNYCFVVSDITERWQSENDTNQTELASSGMETWTLADKRRTKTRVRRVLLYN